MASKTPTTVKKLLNVTEHKYSPMQVPVWVGEDCYMVEHQDYRKIEDSRQICYSKFTDKGLVPIDVNNESNSAIVSSITSAANNLYAFEQPLTHDKRDATQIKTEQTKVQGVKEKGSASPQQRYLCPTFKQQKLPADQLTKGATATNNPVPPAANAPQVPLMISPDNGFQNRFVPHLPTNTYTLPNVPVNTAPTSDIQNKLEHTKIQAPKEKSTAVSVPKKRDICQTFRSPKAISPSSSDQTKKGYTTPMANPVQNQNYQPAVSPTQMPMMMNPESGFSYCAPLMTMPYTTPNPIILSPDQKIDLQAALLQNKNLNLPKTNEQNYLSSPPLYPVPEYFCNDPETYILNISHF